MTSIEHFETRHVDCTTIQKLYPTQTPRHTRNTQKSKTASAHAIMAERAINVGLARPKRLATLCFCETCFDALDSNQFPCLAKHEHQIVLGWGICESLAEDRFRKKHTKEAGKWRAANKLQSSFLVTPKRNNAKYIRSRPRQLESSNLQSLRPGLRFLSAGPDPIRSKRSARFGFVLQSIAPMASNIWHLEYAGSDRARSKNTDTVMNTHCTQIAFQDQNLYHTQNSSDAMPEAGSVRLQ